VKQVQNLATPILWFARKRTAPTEFLAGTAAAPTAAQGLLWSYGPDQTDSMATVSGDTLVTRNGDVNVTGTPQADAVAGLAAFSAVANGLTWLFAANQSDAVAGLASSPATSNGSTWVFAANQTENIATLSAAPIAANGP
jgi:hypothetical protein